ncbi:hypothetical protein J3E68DRAFT_402070 [Trichoderma sp. SZMC 28012]
MKCFLSCFYFLGLSLGRFCLDASCGTWRFHMSPFFLYSLQRTTMDACCAVHCVLLEIDRFYRYPCVVELQAGYLVKVVERL